MQRPLWGSTSTKDPRYPDTLYADGLIGPDTVVPLSPPGSWDHPNHYMWERNLRYPFYPLTVREYLQDRLTTEAGESSP